MALGTPQVGRSPIRRVLFSAACENPASQRRIQSLAGGPQEQARGTLANPHQKGRKGTLTTRIRFCRLSQTLARSLLHHIVRSSRSNLGG
jgi:hypothetical protein